MRSFKDLRVWQAGMELVKEVYVLTREFPGGEQFGLTSQMRRAAVSIPSNIAEGHARRSTRDYLRFLSIARGSLAELMTQAELALRLEFATAKQVTPIIDRIDALMRQLTTMAAHLEERLHSHHEQRPA